MTAVCDHCGGWIDADNRAHPGYCSPSCSRYGRRDVAVAARARKARRLRNRQHSRGERTSTAIPAPSRPLDDNAVRGIR